MHRRAGVAEDQQLHVAAERAGEPAVIVARHRRSILRGTAGAGAPACPSPVRPPRRALGLLVPITCPGTRPRRLSAARLSTTPRQRPLPGALHARRAEPVRSATAFIRGHHWRVGETADMPDRGGPDRSRSSSSASTTPAPTASPSTRPTRDTRHGGGKADAYGRLLVEELKPHIDASYRHAARRAHTGLGGSSLGGLVDAVPRAGHPDVFSRLAVFSPSVWWDQRAILRTSPATRARCARGSAGHGHRGGTLRAARARPAAQRAGERRVAQGENLAYAEHEGARHSEDEWAKRVGPMLEFLFPRTS